MLKKQIIFWIIAFISMLAFSMYIMKITYENCENNCKAECAKYKNKEKVDKCINNCIDGCCMIFLSDNIFEHYFYTFNSH